MTVPFDVLEWYIDVLDGAAVVVQEWLDYEGYDDTPREELAKSMASEIEDFLEKILDRDVRLSRPKSTLEWKIEESWEQALPFFNAGT